MQSVRRYCWVGLLILLLAGPSPAANGRLVMEGDSRGEQTVRIIEQGEYVSAILETLSKKCQVPLSAAAPMGDTVIVCRYEGSLRGFMEALSSFFAADREHRPRWLRYGKPGAWRYRLERDLSTVGWVEQLRREREEILHLRMEASLRASSMSAEEWAALDRSDPRLAEGLKHALPLLRQLPTLQWLARLSPSQRRFVYSGGQVTRPLEQIVRPEDRRRVIRELLGEQNADALSGRGNLTLYMTGPSPLQRALCKRLDSDPEHPGMGMRGGIGIPEIFPDLSPQRQQQEWRGRYGDPAPTDEKPLRLLHARETRQRDVTRGELFLRLALRARINLIADDVGQSISLQLVPESGGLSLLLDVLCQYLPGADDRGMSNHAFFWRKASGTYMVRSLAWPEEETRLIPYRWIRTWRQSERKNGRLSVDDIAAMASLHPYHLMQLARWYPQARLIARVQAPLRWYARSSPRLRERLKRAPGVSIAELGILKEDLALRDSDPMQPPPIYLERIATVSPHRLYMRIIPATTKPELGAGGFPVCVLQLQEMDGYWPKGHPWGFSIPLIRNYQEHLPTPRPATR